MLPCTLHFAASVRFNFGFGRFFWRAGFGRHIRSLRINICEPATPYGVNGENSNDGLRRATSNFFFFFFLYSSVFAKLVTSLRPDLRGILPWPRSSTHDRRATSNGANPTVALARGGYTMCDVVVAG